MSTKTHTLEPWSQGRLLLTTKTRQWSSEQRERADAIEKKMVFVNFSEQDAGKLRRRVAFCETEEDAARIVACVNAMTGIDDPERYRQERDGVHYQYNEMRKYCDHFRAQRDELLAALKELVASWEMEIVDYELLSKCQDLIQKIQDH